MEKQLKDAVQSCVDTRKDDLHRLSQDIWSRPEVGGEEKNAHDRLVHFFSQEQSWTVESHYKLPTAFRASWGPVDGAEGKPVLNVAFLCEYDALPGIGHACGHNLIAEVGAAAALGLKAALENVKHPFPVKITVLGTPAEETEGGKIELIKAGAFADVDLALMAHPAQQDAVLHSVLAVMEVLVKYHGKESHASAYPWEGVNALDAAVLAYNNISVLRQQLNPDWRIHGDLVCTTVATPARREAAQAQTLLDHMTEDVLLQAQEGKMSGELRIITHGGERPNIIPAYTELHYDIRVTRLKELSELKAKVEACFRAAAQATGCKVEISYPGNPYYDILPNMTLKTLYENNGKALGMQFPEQPLKFSGSTDFGNVSYVVPGIHPFYYIGTDALNHTKEYTEAAGAEKAQVFTLRAAKALAMTAVDVVCSPDLLQKVREDFRLAKTKNGEMASRQ